MHPSPLAVEQNPRYIIFFFGKSIVITVYPAIDRVASPTPWRARSKKERPVNNLLKHEISEMCAYSSVTVDRSPKPRVAVMIKTKPINIQFFLPI
jgi:hypothetical protein